MQNLNDINSSSSEDLKSDNKIYLFKLYIAGDSIISLRAINNAKYILNKHLEGRHKLDIIDINKNPEIVISENIITIPLLIKKEPVPTVRVTGDLSDENKVFRALSIN